MQFSGFTEISWLIRSTLDICDSYECAQKRFSSNDISSLGYITIAGTEKNQGAVISRNRMNSAHVDQLDTENGKWYVV